MKYIDLHIHSVFSGGDLIPSEIITRAKRENIIVLSLTDHNSIDGVSEALVAAAGKGVKVIPGVELYTEFQGEQLHLLGYGIDIKDKALNGFLRRAQDHHHGWARKTLQKMEKAGFKVDWNYIQRSKSKYLGFRYLKDALKGLGKKKGSKETLFEFINRWFAKGRPGYVPGQHLKISTPSAIRLIKKAGGIAVLAHPGQQLAWKEDDLIIKLNKTGLDGLEVLSPYHNFHQIEHYQKLALKRKLLITGGSDFHGDLVDEKKLLIRSSYDYFKVPYSVYRLLEADLRRHQRR